MIKEKKNKYCKLAQNEIEKISNRLESFKYILPNDFNRRCRSLTYWKQWKATEFRHFLLYFGAIILIDVLKPDIYRNFLKLHVSTIILSNDRLVKNSANVEYAQALNIDFIMSFQDIYGKENVTFNVHALSHLAKDDQKYGPLEKFSAFIFEKLPLFNKKIDKER